MLVVAPRGSSLTSVSSHPLAAALYSPFSLSLLPIVALTLPPPSPLSVGVVEFVLHRGHRDITRVTLAGADCDARRCLCSTARALHLALSRRPPVSPLRLSFSSFRPCAAISSLLPRTRVYSPRPLARSTVNRVSDPPLQRVLVFVAPPDQLPPPGIFALSPARASPPTVVSLFIERAWAARLASLSRLRAPLFLLEASLEVWVRLAGISMGKFTVPRVDQTGGVCLDVSRALQAGLENAAGLICAILARPEECNACTHWSTGLSLARRLRMCIQDVRFNWKRRNVK